MDERRVVDFGVSIKYTRSFQTKTKVSIKNKKKQVIALKIKFLIFIRKKNFDKKKLN